MKQISSILYTIDMVGFNLSVAILFVCWCCYIFKVQVARFQGMDRPSLGQNIKKIMIYAAISLVGFFVFGATIAFFDVLLGN